MAPRRLIGNWKMNGGLLEVEALAATLSEPRSRDLSVSVCPPYPLIAPLLAALEGSANIVGAQDCHHASHGPYTGEVSANLLAELGVGLVILGHSERRIGRGEDNALISQKVRAAQAAGLEVVLCVGETLEQRNAGHALDVVVEQLKASLALVQTWAGLSVAYEPVWAIGSGRVPAQPEITAMCACIRGWLLFRFEALVPVLYGGSVSVENAADFLAIKGVDGLLVGGASLKASSWRDLIAIAAKAPTPALT